MISALVMWSLVAVLTILLWRREPAAVRPAVAVLATEGPPLLVRIPIALLAAGFLEALLPTELVQGQIGAESGVTGILLASVVGGFIPGGPFVSFPVAVAFFRAGAGLPQLTALLTAWSVFAFHRVIAYELPLMGPRFVITRLLASALLPPLAGGLAWVVFSLMPGVGMG